MASFLQSRQRSVRGEPADEDLGGIEQWFLSKGVPQFVYDFSAVDSMPMLFYMLLIVVAFDLAIGSWVSVSPWFLLIAPAAFVSVGFALWLFVKVSIIDPARNLVGELTEEQRDKDTDEPFHLGLRAQISCLASHPIQLTMLLVAVYFISWVFFLLGVGIVWSDYSVDFVVIMVLLWSSARLFSPDAWQGADAALRVRQRRLYLVVTVAIVAFALEGSVFPDATVLMGTVMPVTVAVPHALAALLVAVIIVFQSHGLIAELTGTGDDGDQQPIAADELARQRLNYFFPILPLLILVFCAETAILPYISSIWTAAAIPLAALATLHVLYRRHREKRPPRSDGGRLPRWRRPRWLTGLMSQPRVRRFLDDPRVRVFRNAPSVTSLVVLYLVACPVLVGVLVGSDSRFADARSTLLVAFAINLFYLLVVAGIAMFGLNEVAKWASREAWTDLRQRISNLGRGLSILAVFAALALLTAETWEAMRDISTRDFWMLVGAILGLAGAFHLLTSLQHVAKTAAFDSWSDVYDGAILEGETSRNGDTRPDREIKKLFDRKELRSASITNDAPTRRLGILETINIVIVMMTYEIFFFFPVTIVAAVVFLAFGYITVPREVAANWIFGDRASRAEIDELRALPLFQQPWIRVGLLLTAFSILYLVVEILSDPDKRSSYFESADKAVRQRLAVRLAYCEVRARRAHPKPATPRSRPDRRSRSSATSS
jgi:hypothetical protein